MYTMMKSHHKDQQRCNIVQPQVLLQVYRGRGKRRTQILRLPLYLCPCENPCVERILELSILFNGHHVFIFVFVFRMKPENGLYYVYLGPRWKLVVYQLILPMNIMNVLYRCCMESSRISLDLSYWIWFPYVYRSFCSN